MEGRSPRVRGARCICALEGILGVDPRVRGSLDRTSQRALGWVDPRVRVADAILRPGCGRSPRVRGSL